ncbi:predicted protein [Sclerotinia sclerotiorum 1980 UF-70]|uniref:Uncharacterized protein n=2 Tax=Sclerotinia sclerotiorum (strain ATCC 18683 / 1980 / Ss-1) TaxID=665079 RepID=A0A1D9QA74_SCLS1|nr:predicted protein [Sclerotinia sclerotiorum 1980 UF-70]APA11860.1 hypothetical protein sscle_08g066300 [Sclerotinia sclerotiorum 1980 UF-70]EDO02896.1 predicted protein [Sclerotinia sclerotiorum 1980 UF-70]
MAPSKAVEDEEDAIERGGWLVMLVCGMRYAIMLVVECWLTVVNPPKICTVWFVSPQRKVLSVWIYLSFGAAHFRDSTFKLFNVGAVLTNLCS